MGEVGDRRNGQEEDENEDEEVEPDVLWKKKILQRIFFPPMRLATSC